MKDNDVVEEKFKLNVCPRCKNKNSPESKFCNVCGLCLDVTTAMQLDDLRSRADKLITELVKNPREMETLLGSIEKIKSRGQQTI